MLDDVRLVLGNGLESIHFFLVGAHDFSGIELGVHRGDFVGLNVDLFLKLFAALEQHFLFVLKARVLVVFLKLDLLGALLKILFLAGEFLFEALLILFQFHNIRFVVDHFLFIRLHAIQVALVGGATFLCAPVIFLFLAPDAVGLILVQTMQSVIQISEAILVVEVRGFLGANSVAHQILVMLKFLFKFLKCRVVFLKLGGIGLFDLIDFAIDLRQLFACALARRLVSFQFFPCHQFLAGTGFLQLNLSVLNSRLGFDA